MSVCDVPLCPNLSVGGTQPLMGAPKGVPRVNKPCSETRDRLRIRLNQRKAKYSFNPNVSYSVQVGALSKIAEQGINTDKKILTTTKQESAEDRPITNLIKKAGIEACIPKQPCNPLPLRRGCIKKCDTKDCPNLVDVRSNKSNVSNSKEKEKENNPVEESENDGGVRSAPIYEDIDKIMKFIEGKDYELAQKKAAKKARQKHKKEEEKRKKEENEKIRLKAEADRIKQEKRLEEERLRTEQIAKQILAKKQKKNNKNQQPVAAESTKSKKKNKKNKGGETCQPEQFEETIPAMVTIKRIVENNNSPPTVTITLKGSTPDQDKLLYTLVNGHENRNGTDSKTNGSGKKDEAKSGKKKKKNSEKCEAVTTKELKVTLSVDKSFRRELENKNLSREVASIQNQNTQGQNKNKNQIVDKNKNKETFIDIPSLKLPPGITITKVNGPLANKKTNNVQSSDYQSVPVNKSGVIVVDTEKLIQQSIGTKKSKKKKKKTQQVGQAENGSMSVIPDTANAAMVTLKNPIFHKLQNKMSQPDATHLLNINEQATISKGANGMVTIRRPRQISLQNEAPVSDYVIHSNTQTVNSNVTASHQESKSTLSEERKIIRPPSPRATNSLSNTPQIDLESNRLCPQNILWGLPGIQITRVQKNSVSNETEHADQAADVSIIRTGGFNLEKDDWPYESVFTPKDILEDDLDADERELEAFKRFCQQSVPPKHKEKVAHLNVKDIVLMKKNDITYS